MHRFQPTLKPKPTRASRLSVAAQQHSTNTLSLSCGATTIKLPISNDKIETLAGAVNSLLKTFADKQKAERPQRCEPVECRITGMYAVTTHCTVLYSGKDVNTPFMFPFIFSYCAGDAAQGEVPVFEIFCNPNAHTTAFDAKVLITLQTGEGVQVVTEAPLEQVRAGVKDALMASRATAS